MIEDKIPLTSNLFLQKTRIFNKYNHYWPLATRISELERNKNKKSFSKFKEIMKNHQKFLKITKGFKKMKNKVYTKDFKCN